eukprot:1375545-Rhodomonas_salina.4
MLCLHCYALSGRGIPDARSRERAAYALSGTGIASACSLSGTDLAYAYSLPGTDIAYACSLSGTGATRCPVLTSRDLQLKFDEFSFTCGCLVLLSSLVPYRFPMRCPVLTQPMLLHMSGTDLGFAAMPVVPLRTAISLRVSYAMSGTEMAYQGLQKALYSASTSPLST